MPVDSLTRIGGGLQIYRAISQCRLCRDTHLVPVIDLGQQALTGRFPAADESDPPMAPLSVLRCAGCGLVQLEHSADAGLMFSSSYGYRSGLTLTMRDHLSGIARALERRGDLGPGDLVLDIGCHDATLLKSYSVDVTRVGIDPLAELFRPYYQPSLRIHGGNFDRAAFRNVSPSAKANIVTSIAVFYDVEDPGAFVTDVAHVLAPDGIWLLEQSYFPTVVVRTPPPTTCPEPLVSYPLPHLHPLPPPAP